VNARLALVPLVALVALTAPAATAAPKAKVACNIVTDPTGDTFAFRSQDGVANGPQEDGLDIVSGDLSSNGKVVTAAIRVKKLSRSVPTSPEGITLGLGFYVGDGTDIVRLQAALPTGQPDRFEVAVLPAGSLPNQPANFVGTVTGAVDLAKNEVRITAPASMLAPFGTIKPGSPLTPGDAESAVASRGVPPITSTPGAPMTTRGPFADVAVGGSSIKVGAKSCLVPGK
jgi:hypothetical protein